MILLVLEAIIFDLDGTIVNSTEVQWFAFNEFLLPYEAKIAWEDWTKEYLGWKSEKIWEAVLEKNKLKFSIEYAQKERRRIYNRLVKEGKLKEIDGFSKFFNWLKKILSLNFPIVIASNGHNTSIKTSLTAIGYFNKIKYFSANIGQIRVSKKVLLRKVAHDLAVEPTNCLVIEDSPLGAEAASKNAMKTVIINTSNLSNDNFKVDLIIKDYTSPRLFSFIEKIK